MCYETDVQATGNKTVIRELMRQKRQKQPPHLALIRSAAAQRRLLAQSCWREAQGVALYMAFRGELATDMLLEDAWQNGRDVFLPRVCKRETGRMEFVACTGREQLCPGAFGLFEPLPTLPGFGPEEANTSFTPDLLVAPGVAFDKNGLRLGFGGGYYDRFLGASGLSCQRVGLCFSFQIVEKLPADAWDQRMHALCTDEDILWI